MEKSLLDNNTEQQPEEMKVTFQAYDSLRIAAKWSKTLAIIGFIGIGIATLVVLSAATMLGPLVFLYIIAFIIPLLPLYYLYKFAIETKEALYANNSDYLSNALDYLASYFKFNGIIAIIVIGIYAALLIFALLVGGFKLF